MGVFNQNKLSISERIVSWVPIIIPILTGYKGLFVDLGSCLLILAFGFALLMNGKRRITVSNLDWLVYVAYIIVITALSLNFYHYTEPAQYVLRTIKYLIYIFFTLYITSTGLFKIEYASKCLVNVSLFATGYLALQNVLYYGFHFGLPGYVPSLVLNEMYANRAANIMQNTYRPTSIFLEPAHYATYIMLALIMLLFSNSKKPSIKRALFLTLGLFLSTSGQGIFFGLVVWILWFITCNLNKMRVRLAIMNLFLILLGSIGIVSFFLSSRGQYILSRVFSSGDYGNAIAARAVGFLFISNNSTGLFQTLFGMGYGNVDLSVFYSTWSFTIWSLGIIGTLIVLTLYINKMIQIHSVEYKVIILINMIMGVFSTLFLGVTMVQWFSFILAKERQEQCEKQVLNFSPVDRGDCFSAHIF